MTDLVKRLRDKRNQSETWCRSRCLEAADRIEELEAALAWRPIETCPRDREYYLCYSPGNPKATVKRAKVAHMKVDRYHPDQSDIHIERDLPRWNELPEALYTHWMPLPKPPKE